MQSLYLTFICQKLETQTLPLMPASASTTRLESEKDHLQVLLQHLMGWRNI